MSLGFSGCSGEEAPAGASGGGDPATADRDGQNDASVPESPRSPLDPTDCFATRVRDARTDLDLCRTCHREGGVARSEAWSLGSDPDQDPAHVRAAWDALGLKWLKTPAQLDGLEHPGGAVLKPDSAAYARLSAAVAALATPEICAPGSTGEAEAQRPLLGSARGGHLWATFCADQPDDAPLPTDPRTLVQPGVNAQGVAIFNAFWTDCDHDAPRTCGEYRAGLARGKEMMEGGRLWFFGGHHTDAMLTISAQDYNNLWRDWGLSKRPRDFDQRVAERWGIPLGETRNPYPLPGEDPNATGGGSGQLPVALTQLRDEDGRYLGKISFNCHWCHSGKVGEASDGPGLGMVYGNGNSLLDVTAGFGKFMGGITGLIPIAANKVRGTGDILLYPAIAALDVDRAQHYNESLIVAPAQGSVDYPVWWNVGHRTRRFHDGSFAMDDARPVMGFFMPIFTYSRILDIQGGRAWIDERDDDVQLWLESLRAPAYPGSIDKNLAEAGAILFHNKDLWAPSLNNPVPRPEGGNGSCASCHGVYAPRYVHDPAYLERPELEGIAAFVVPMDIIGTDPARYNSLNDGLKQTLQYSWWSYGTVDEPGACFGAIDEGGYLAPPLYGVWATAPYFHNGSVPNVWEVLKPSERKPIWRRVSAPPPDDDPDAFTGYDTNLARAYDHERLGWKYDVLECGDPAREPELDCSPAEAETSEGAAALGAGPYDSVWFTWNIAPQPQDAQTLEKRKIYNTYKYSQSNAGHAFTTVLTDDERRALIEYLKTL